MDAFPRDVFGDKTQHLNPRPCHPDFLFDILFGGIEPARQLAAEFNGELMILYKFDATEDYNAAEGVCPAAFIANTVRVTLLVVLGVAVLQQLGVATTSVIAILSAAAAAVVVALKDSLGNVAGGFLILVN